MKKEHDPQKESSERNAAETFDLIPPSYLSAYDESRKDSNFHKVFLEDYLKALEPLANQKTKICYWIIRNMKRNNQLQTTFRQIAAATNTSYGTVAKTIKQLQEENFICKLSSGCYIINPDIIFKGSLQRRMITRSIYQDAIDSKEISSNEKLLAEYEKEIKKLERQQKKLQTKIDIMQSKL